MRSEDDTGAAPRTLAEIPFPRRDPVALLNLAPGPSGERRAEPDADFDGYGWSTLDSVVLEPSDGPCTVLGPTLVLALHCTDQECPSGLELELDIPDPSGALPLSVLAPLDGFLNTHLPRLPGGQNNVVLALCNPRSVVVERPDGLGSRALYFAYGDVLSWLDEFELGRTQIRLSADAWHRR